MKKILALLLAGFLLPALAFAAYNDVSIGNGTAVLSVNGITINIGGPSVVLETLEVGATTFTLTVKSGSFFTASADGLKVMTASSNPSITVSTNCTTVESSITVTATTDSTVTITPSSSTCPSASASVGGGPISSGSGGGGGGGSSVPYSPPSTPAVAPGSTPVSGLTVVQVEAILSLLTSFDTDAATLASVRAVLYGQASSGTGASATFSRNLEIGMTGDDVKALQVYLNANGYTVAVSGPGSAGNETTKFGSATRAALIKFQKAKGITPAVGYFGPKTRASINK